MEHPHGFASLDRQCEFDEVPSEIGSDHQVVIGPFRVERMNNDPMTVRVVDGLTVEAVLERRLGDGCLER